MRKELLLNYALKKCRNKGLRNLAQWEALKALGLASSQAGAGLEE